MLKNIFKYNCYELLKVEVLGDWFNKLMGVNIAPNFAILYCSVSVRIVWR